ncbi:hypothetical protein [Luteolibacter soli]
MNKELYRYLNDHLAGSAGAIGIIEKLADTADDPEEAAFFRELGEKVETDRTILKDLIGKLGESSSSLLEAAGVATGAASRIKLAWEGLEPGHLGRFEALELLALGIQGKRLLWLALAEIAPLIPAWTANFAELELDAIAQRDSVEERRVEAARDALSPS